MAHYHPDYPDVPDKCVVDPVELVKLAGADPEWGRLARLSSLHGIELLQTYHDLCGVAVGHPWRRGHMIMDEKAFLFFVRKKLAPKKIPKGQRIPRKFAGCQTDVVEVGGSFRPAQCDPRAYTSVIQGALSIGIEGDLQGPPGGRQVGGFGTLGIVARNIGSNTEVYVTNQHVASRRVNVSSNGTVMTHPAEIHAIGTSMARLGRISHSVPILPPPFPNFVDFAKGRAHPRFARPPVSPLHAAPTVDVGEVLCGGRVGSFAVPIPFMGVRKRGVTTLTTEGIVVGFGAAITISYDTLTAFFLDQIICAMGNDEGDSGSAVLQMGSNNFVGMLNGGFGPFAIASPWWWLVALGGIRV